jgi:hypothetical protein
VEPGARGNRHDSFVGWWRCCHRAGVSQPWESNECLGVVASGVVVVDGINYAALATGNTGCRALQ